MNDPKKPLEPAETAPLRLRRVRAGVKAGSLNAYISKAVGEKQGAFKGGTIQKG